MKKRKKKNRGVIQEFLPFSISGLFSPTTEMAAELMAVSKNVVEKWLSLAHFSLDEDGHLTDDAIDFLAEKYVDRLQRYFDNYQLGWDGRDDQERLLFKRFISRYGKTQDSLLDKWNNLDAESIAEDFKQVLRSKAIKSNSESYCFNRGRTMSSGWGSHVVLSHELELLKSVFEKADFDTELDDKQELNYEAEDSFSFCPEYIDFSGYIISHLSEDEITCANSLANSEIAALLSDLSHSQYYLSRIKTKIPAQPEYRSMILEILQEKRFHIFTGESDSNALIDAISLSNVKQPQLAIASVFGYLRHKNKESHEYSFKTQTYCCC